MNARPINAPKFGPRQFNQPVPSPVWVIEHHLNKNPSVLVFVGDGITPVGAQVDYIDLNTVHIRFNQPESGRAVLQ